MEYQVRPGILRGLTPFVYIYEKKFNSTKSKKKWYKQDKFFISTDLVSTKYINKKEISNDWLVSEREEYFTKKKIWYLKEEDKLKIIKQWVG